MTYIVICRCHILSMWSYRKVRAYATKILQIHYEISYVTRGYFGTKFMKATSIFSTNNKPVIMEHMAEFLPCFSCITLTNFFSSCNKQSQGIQLHSVFFSLQLHHTIHGPLPFRLHQNVTATTGIEPTTFKLAAEHPSHCSIEVDWVTTGLSTS